MTPLLLVDVVNPEEDGELTSPTSREPDINRPKLEVADIFRRHGEAWRAAMKGPGYLSLTTAANVASRLF